MGRKGGVGAAMVALSGGRENGDKQLDPGHVSATAKPLFAGTSLWNPHRNLGEGDWAGC